MAGSGVMKVVTTVGRGLAFVARGHTARLVVVAAAVGVVTISVAMAAGMVMTIRALGASFLRIPATDRKDIPRIPR